MLGLRGWGFRVQRLGSRVNGGKKTGRTGMMSRLPPGRCVQGYGFQEFVYVVMGHGVDIEFGVCI